MRSRRQLVARLLCAALSLGRASADELAALNNPAERVKSLQWGVAGGSFAGAAGDLEVDEIRVW